jgi:hypothetical protein
MHAEIKQVLYTNSPTNLLHTQSQFSDTFVPEGETSDIALYGSRHIYKFFCINCIYEHRMERQCVYIYLPISLP